MALSAVIAIGFPPKNWWAIDLAGNLRNARAQELHSWGLRFAWITRASLFCSGRCIEPRLQILEIRAGLFGM